MKTPHTLRILNSSKSLEVKQKRCELGQWEAQLVKMLAVQAQWPVWCLAPCKGGREELTLKSCPLASINALWHCLSHKQNSRRTVGLCGTVTCLGSCSWKQRGVEDEKVSSQQTHGGGEAEEWLHYSLEAGAACQTPYPTDSEAEGRGEKSELNRNGKELPSPGLHRKRGSSVSSDFDSQEVKEYQKWRV